jgi:hypothetical protein
MFVVRIQSQFAAGGNRWRKRVADRYRDISTCYGDGDVSEQQPNVQPGGRYRDADRPDATIRDSGRMAPLKPGTGAKPYPFIWVS